MKRVLLILSFIIFSVVSFSQEGFVKNYSELITAGNLKDRLIVIAGAEMEGRATATEGQRRAARYIESEMKSIGLEPAKGRDYQVIFPLFQDSVVHISMAVNGKPLVLNDDFSAKANNSPARQLFSEVLYIDFDDTDWKNEKINVAGKLAMILANEQKGGDAVAAFNAQVASLQKRGAAAFLIVEKRYPLKTTEPALGSMRLKKFPAAQALNQYSISPGSAIVITGSQEWDKKGCKTFKADIELDYSDVVLTKFSSNVLGVLPAVEPTDEWVLITAHYDHLGKKDSVIWYGADDNGTGTATVLELAKTFAKAKKDNHGVKKNILFMTVSGEENGLLGSEYFTNYPVYPLEKISANINIDMIGRRDTLYEKSPGKNYVYLVGDDKLSSEFASLAKEANKPFGLELDPKFNDTKDKQRIYFRSDHYNFAQKGVPALFFYDGGHRDYHRPTDTVEKIEFDLMELRARYIFTISYLIANKPGLLKRDLDLKAIGER